MSARTVIGVVVGALLFALSVIPHSIQTDVCSPYAAQRGVNPGPPTPESPHGIIACDDFSVTAIGDTPSALTMLVMCVVGSVLLIRVARLRSVLAVAGIGVVAAFLGSWAGFIYSGLGVGDLVSDPGFHFSLVVAGVVAAIMAALELRRLPIASLERTRGE